MADGVRLAAAGHAVQLKWHRLRRGAADIDFGIARLRDGLAAGAAMEVDLRCHAEGGFVCLHDETLDRETDGSGPILGKSPDQLRRLRLRGRDGAATDQPPLLLEDLVDILAPARSDARVQLDLKEPRARLSNACIRNFAGLAARCAGRLSLSGEDWQAVSALGSRVPGLELGFDPCELPEVPLLHKAADFAAFVRLTLATAPMAAMIYLQYPLILASLDAGFDIVAAFHDAGRRVDAWTLDPSMPGFAASLRRLVACRVDQITTNDAIGVQSAWEKMGAGRG